MAAEPLVDTAARADLACEAKPVGGAMIIFKWIRVLPKPKADEGK
jgi:hypothetical protein